ncbi:hypothetical protein BAUCODRAFT_20579 [Baudoinia panamericana UAMH 10762]|uniref:C3H1-type domain-containing protein n=1 Tax=Baudoinia panamericana (strain UAMH 10762) TaxID=717646 RepID=M2NMR8_BAUPA|nr:uncharacterized protein BAUCODRAFT_20579 [Baudoinia panamericana UAMH 10762]EMD00486.1 hypothetical protein BAUCODRAFT_20579 [Baudoinia panamericana UAMH 10762]
MNGHSTAIMPYADRLKAFRKSDEERDSMIAEILRNYEELQLKYNEKCDDYNNEIESRRMWQSKARSTEAAFNEQKQASGSNNFAVAILDGDGAVFNDYLYAQGKEGGADAAHQLYTALRNNLLSLYPEANVSDWSIVVYIVLNIQGLGTKLQACGIIANPNELTGFGRAFSLAQPLFTFIDVGSGKERADHKVRETLRLFLPNAQCKHVFFGPCHDNGYLPVLEPYRLDSNTASKLTLLETLPAAPGFTQLGLKQLRCPRVFRGENLPAKPVIMPNSFASPSPTITANVPIRSQQSMSAATASFVPQSTAKTTAPMPSPSPSVDPGASNTWAVIGNAEPAAKNISIAPRKTPAKKHMTLNVHGERLDPPLPEKDPAAFKRFADRVNAQGNCCNSYHLTGKCKSGENCKHAHGDRLSPGELLILRHKARSLKCPNQYACRDINCLQGHHCKFGSGCRLDHCRFSDTHSMDLPAKRAYEDGTEDFLPSYLEKYQK